MSLTGCLGCIGTFISESMRFILFFASIFFMIISIALMVFSSLIRVENLVLDVHAADNCSTALIAVAVYLIVLSILGICGTFFRSESCIGWVSRQE